MPRNYCYIYQELVGEEGDVVGHIAYSLYKKNKSQFIHQFSEEHEGKELTEEEFGQFNRFAMTGEQIRNYRARAELVLQDFLVETVSDSVEEARERVFRNIEDHLKRVIEPMKPPPSWKMVLRGLGVSLMGAFLFSLIVAGFYLITQNGKGEQANIGLEPADSVNYIDGK